MVSRNLDRQFYRLPPPSLRVRFTSLRGRGLRLNVRVSAVRLLTRQEHLCKMSHPTEPGPRTGCWATGFGPLNVRRVGVFVRYRQTRVRAASELARLRTIFPSPCPHSVRAEIHLSTISAISASLSYRGAEMVAHLVHKASLAA